MVPGDGPDHCALLKVGGVPGEGVAVGVGKVVAVGVGVPPIPVAVAVGVAVLVGVGVALEPPCRNRAKRLLVTCCEAVFTSEDEGPQGDTLLKPQSHWMVPAPNTQAPLAAW